LHSTLKTCSHLVGRLCRLLVRPASCRSCRAWPRACPSASEASSCAAAGARGWPPCASAAGATSGAARTAAHSIMQRAIAAAGGRDAGSKDAEAAWRFVTLERASAPAVSPGCLRRSGRLVLLGRVQPPARGSALREVIARGRRIISVPCAHTFVQAGLRTHSWEGAAAACRACPSVPLRNATTTGWAALNDERVNV